jgi:ribosomal protein S18 acetylase RimI-like enzyme
LHHHVRAAAKGEPEVIGLRLYVEVENHRAHATYRSLGFKAGGYDVYEDLWIPGSQGDETNER